MLCSRAKAKFHDSSAVNFAPLGSSNLSGTGARLSGFIHGGTFCCVQDSQCAETWDCTLLLWARPLWQVLGDCKGSPHTRVLPPSLLVQAPCAEPWGRVFGLAAGRPLWLGLWCGTLGVSSRLGAAGGSCVALGGLGCRVLLGNPRLRRWCSTAYREHPKNL